jgi:hypothetical protein
MFIISSRFASEDAIHIVSDKAFGQTKINGLIKYMTHAAILQELADNHTLLL